MSAHGDLRPGRLVEGEGEGPAVRWARPERRVAPGQALVAYDGEVVVAWATATRVVPSRPAPPSHPG